MPLKDLLGVLTWRSKARKGRNAAEGHQMDDAQPLQQIPASQVEGQEDQKSKGFRWYGNGHCLRRAFSDGILDQTNNKMSSRLIKYLDQGNISAFKRELSEKTSCEIDGIRIAGQSLLHMVCVKRDIDALRLLLDKKIQVNQHSDDGTIPLHLAVRLQWFEGVEELVKSGAQTQQIPEIEIPYFGIKKELPILTAVRNGDYETSCLLLERDPDLSTRDPQYNSIVHLAAYSHCPPLLEKILDHPFTRDEINTTNESGYFPIHMLMDGPNLEDNEDEIVDCLRLLSINGAEINNRNGRQETPLYLAARVDLPKVVGELLNAGGDPLIMAESGRSVLHAACLSGSHESLSILIETGFVKELILREDSFNLTPFHMAASSSSIECCQLLLENGDHLTFQDKCSNGSKCQLAFRQMSSASELLKRVLDSCIDTTELDRYNPQFALKIDFSSLLSGNDDVQGSIVSDITNSASESLLKHPVLDAFLNVKWQKIRYYFYTYVLLYFFFLVVHTFYIIKTFHVKLLANQTMAEWTDSEITAVHGIHVVMFSVLLFPGLIIIFANFKKYFSQFETYFKLIALVSACYVVFSHNADLQKTEGDRLVACVSIFFTWIEFMMLLGRFPTLGIYILMFTRVAKSIIKVLAAFSSLIIAFVLVFSLLYQNISVFGSFPIGFVKTLMMMIGEIDYGDIYEESRDHQSNGIATIIVSQIFLVVFLFLIPVLMANLLVGVAVNDLPDLQHHGNIRILVKKAAYLVAYERIIIAIKTIKCIPNVLLDRLFRFGKVARKFEIYPNKKDKNERGDTCIPKEAIDEAIAIGRKQDEEEEDDIGEKIDRFIEEYMLRQLNTEIALAEIMRVLNKDESASTDPESPSRILAKRHSGSVKKRRKFVKFF